MSEVVAAVVVWSLGGKSGGKLAIGTQNFQGNNFDASSLN